MTDELAFAELCREETEVLHRLLAFLEDEQSALINGEVCRLEPIALEKAQMLDILDRQSDVRAQWMKTRAIYHAETVLTWLFDKPEANSAWTTLEASFKRVKVLNELNGRFIDERLAYTNDALTALYSLSANTGGYRPDGSVPSVPTGGRRLGSA